MPWVVGIDEAGYGPNLGPLVQTAVAIRLPDHDHAGWETLKPCIRRCGEPDDGRLLIDDSKKVYAGGKGLANLERGVFVGFQLFESELASVVRKTTLPWVRDELPTEPWYDAAAAVPVTTSCEEMFEVHGRFSERVTGIDYRITLPCGVIVPAGRFNRVVGESGSKATVLARGLVELMAETATDLATISDPEMARSPIVFLCDKLGGRNFYAAMLQHAFPDGWVSAVCESAAESRYRIANLGRDIEVVFRPRADAESVSVALASMLAKYLREVCMIQFNAFWRKHVPELEPTAGYPGDAKRFFYAIRPAMEKLGIPVDAVWRKR
jgi:hypothetical protein